MNKSHHEQAIVNFFDWYSSMDLYLNPHTWLHTVLYRTPSPTTAKCKAISMCIEIRKWRIFWRIWYYVVASKAQAKSCEKRRKQRGGRSTPNACWPGGPSTASPGKFRGKCWLKSSSSWVDQPRPARAQMRASWWIPGTADRGERTWRRALARIRTERVHHVERLVRRRAHAELRPC